VEFMAGDFTDLAHRWVAADDGSRLGWLSHVLLNRSTGAADWLLVVGREGDQHAIPAGLVVERRGDDLLVETHRVQLADTYRLNPGATTSLARLQESLREVIDQLARTKVGSSLQLQSMVGPYDIVDLGAASGWSSEQRADPDPNAGAEFRAPPPSFPLPPAPPSVTRGGWPVTVPGPPPTTSDDVARSLVAELPESVGLEVPFVVEVSIVLGTSRGGATLAQLHVPPEGIDVLVVAHAPGLTELSGQQTATVHVPQGADSDPTLFQFRAKETGRHRILLTAYHGGSFLGRLETQVLVTSQRVSASSQRVAGRVGTEKVAGEVTLTILYDEDAKSLTFILNDQSSVRVVTGQRLWADLRILVEEIIPKLDAYAANQSGLSPAHARSRMENQGMRLWRQLVPNELKVALRERLDSISQLTILCEKDVVPWELLYPHDKVGDQRGFLVEQLPVVRWVLATQRLQRLTLGSPLFVVPGDSPPAALGEVHDVGQRLGVEADQAVISDVAALRAALEAPTFDCLHFACHNFFAPDVGSSLAFVDGDFQPIDLESAKIDRPLAQRGPLVFLNACRTDGKKPTFTSLDGWANAFLDAGASFFIGTSWAVRDATARQFAEVVYGELKGASSLGAAVTTARKAISREVGDSTFLAYTVYGDPRAKVGAP
jgi:hypothetical protein